MPGPTDTFLSAGPAWSSLANTPFRYHKTWNHEGGIASPLIAWWPGVINRPGGISDELSHITDLMATCLDAAGEPYPKNFNGRDVQPLAAKSLLSVLQGESRVGHEFHRRFRPDSTGRRVVIWFGACSGGVRTSS